MPIKFFNHESRQYYSAKWEGIIYDFELIPSYEKFYADFENSSGWAPELAELVYIMDADLSNITQTGLMKLAQWGEALHMRHRISEKKTAILLLQENSSVPASIYGLWAEESPEHVRIYRNEDKAIDWLTE